MKSIYEEVLLKLKEIAENLTRKQWLELTSNIELIRNYLQQQEKLLGLYKDLSNYVCEQCYAHKLSEITRLKIIIKELENDKQIKN